MVARDGSPTIGIRGGRLNLYFSRLFLRRSMRVHLAEYRRRRSELDFELDDLVGLDESSLGPFLHERPMEDRFAVS